ncbi:MAG TPA: phosphate ABC transporter substrate-binding protein PstS, partial [Microbacteriaceae bacterium]|nr:phosphate ABC transporter substrate-binding protein PstS [Microbacteriaceae bacterium]
ALLGLSACAVNEMGINDSNLTTTGGEVKASGNLVGAGASSQGEGQNAWIASFIDVNPNIEVTYDPAGSGAGRENFQQGASSFAGSDRAFNLEEISAGPFAACTPDSDLVELPVYVSPIAIVFNIEGVSALNLDAATIAKMFTGEIKKWNDPAIAEQNPTVTLPELEVTAVHRADKSGTTGNFTDYLSAAAPDVWRHGSVEEWPIEAGEAAPQTSGLINAVVGGQGTIGYVDASRATDLATVSLKVGDRYVPYSPEAAAAVLDASEFEAERAATDLAINIDRTATAGDVYPLVLVSYLIGCESYADDSKAALVKEYFSYVASEFGQKIAQTNAGSAPISDELRVKVEEAIAQID